MESIERINKSFSEFIIQDYSPNPYNRYKGGHRSKSSPFVTGYWYLLIQLPRIEFEKNQNYNMNLFNTSNRKTIEKYLHCVADSFNPPSKTIQKGEVSGFGGIKKYIPLNQQITSNFSITFFELAGMPIHKIFKIWTSMFNSQYGFSHPSVNKGQAYIFQCKPTWTHESRLAPSDKDVEEMFYFEGIFPESDGSDVLVSDISENGIVKYSTQFSFDSYYFGSENSDILLQGMDLLRATVGIYEHKIEKIIPV